MKLSEMTSASYLTGAEELFVLQNGSPVVLTLDDLAAASPDENGVYPDVPLNRIQIKRIVGQQSTIPAISGNVSMLDKILSLICPVLTDTNSRVVAYLNGSDTTKTVDGLNAPLGDPTLQEMARFGGYWYDYKYDATTNTKTESYSVYKVRGYRYVRRLFIGMKSPAVQDGKLISNTGKFSTQNYNVQQYHAFAKATGDNYHEIACTDWEVFIKMFRLKHKTFNSQSVFEQVSQVDWGWWGSYANADSGKSQYGQFHVGGYLNDVAGQSGQKSLTLTNTTGASKTVKPCKEFWVEYGDGFWKWATRYIKKDGVWYKFPLDKIAFTVTADAVAICEEPNKGSAISGSYIMECFEDTLIPTMVNGTASTGLGDGYWQAAYSAGTVYVLALVGAADLGSLCGCSALHSAIAASSAAPTFGGWLASDDPTDTIADGTVAV